jgi:hypothetical protein
MPQRANPSRSRRRSRYTVQLEGEVRHVVLAYDAIGARRYFESRELTVTTVVKGDYRIVAPRGGFRVDDDALRDGCELLGIHHPVRIVLNGRVGPTWGNHRFDGAEHRIMVKSYLTPEQATRTLWHELTHAMQAERVGGGVAWWALCRAQRSYSYSQRPIELDAREMEDVLGDLALCFPLP